MLPGEPMKEEAKARKNKLSPKRELEEGLQKCSKEAMKKR